MGTGEASYNLNFDRFEEVKKMKTDNVYFQCKNGKIDDYLIKAIESLPSEQFFDPWEIELVCYKDTENNIIVYPYNERERIFLIENIDVKDYMEFYTLSKFKVGEFSYKFLNLNPFNICERLAFKRDLFEKVMEEVNKS